MIIPLVLRDIFVIGNTGKDIISIGVIDARENNYKNCNKSKNEM